MNVLESTCMASGFALYRVTLLLSTHKYSKGSSRVASQAIELCVSPRDVQICKFVERKILLPFYPRTGIRDGSGTRKVWVAVRERTQWMGLLAEKTVELHHDGGRLGQPMRILCGHIESDEGSRTVRRSSGRDIPVMRMGFQAQAYVIPLGTQDPDRRSHHRSDLREMAQKGVPGTQDNLFVSDPLRDPPTPL